MTTTEYNQELAGHRDLLFRFALKLTRNYQDAQDLFQDATVRGFRYRERFEMGTNFRAWMSTIIRNTFLTKMRVKQRLTVVTEPIDNFAFALENRNAVGNDGETKLRMESLLGHLDQLSDLYRVPFLMHYKGYEYKEIAEHLDIPIGTVKSRLNTARSTMKKTLAKRA